MSDTPKLTPTFNDTKELKQAQPSVEKVVIPTPLGIIAPDAVAWARETVPPRVVEAHEPLSKEPWTPPEPGLTTDLQSEPVAKKGPKQELDLAPHYKVAILGTAPSSRMLAPFGDPTWKIWACSPGNMGTLPRVDAWCEIHSTLTWPENQGYGMPYLKWLSEQTYPVYMQDIEENNTLVPNFTPFPVEACLNEFGPFFFTSSFSWMMAAAMLKGAKQIALFGVDMASRDEYILQRPGAYYFFMEAKRRGIVIGAPNESDIMQPPPPYGFFETSPFGRKICAREKELKDRISPMRAEIGKLQSQVTYLEGALEDMDYIKNIWGGAQMFAIGPRLSVIPQKPGG
jgi:hypothetical protein